MLRMEIEVVSHGVIMLLLAMKKKRRKGKGLERMKEVGNLAKSEESVKG